MSSALKKLAPAMIADHLFRPRPTPGFDLMTIANQRYEKRLNDDHSGLWHCFVSGFTTVLSILGD
jgi:hypothetical protein